MTQIKCSVSHIKPFIPTVFEIKLTPQTPVLFRPGQYIKVVVGEGDERPFSLANIPKEYMGEAIGDSLYLHIGAQPENPYAWEVLEHLRENSEIMISPAQGNATIRNSQRPVVLVAGGTGFSYTYSILRGILKANPKRIVKMFWGVRKYADLYCLNHIHDVEDDYENVEFDPVVEFPENGWRGLSGFVHHSVIEHVRDLSTYDIYVAGRFEMAKVLRDDFVKFGVPESQIIGDAFDFL